MRADEYCAYDGLGLAALIRGGTVSADEVQQAAFDALTSMDSLNAVVEGPWRQPLDHATDGPLAGVPFVIKDVLLHAGGVPTHMGSRLLREGVVHAHDTELMRRFRSAGLATMATSATPEFALNVSTEPLFDGPTRNPWDPMRTPGGSSGGTAALVAAGAVPWGHANDGAGSIRIPAAHTGLVGLKPTRGRVPLGPDQQEVMYGNATELALTRSVRDTAALLDAVSGFAPGEKYSLPAPSQPFGGSVDDDRGGLKIALHVDSRTSTTTDPAIVRALIDIADALTEFGHTVEFAAPTVDWESLDEALTTTWCAGTAAAVYPLAESLGVEIDESVLERTTIACAKHGARLTPMDLGKAFGAFTTASHVIGEFLHRWDLWLTPTSLVVPPPLGFFDANMPGTASDWVRRCVEFYPYAAIFNITGVPAITVPAGLVDGLPVGAQFAAGMGREDLLLRVAGQVERARPWSRATPDLHVTTTSYSRATH